MFKVSIYNNLNYVIYHILTIRKNNFIISAINQLQGRKQRRPLRKWNLVCFFLADCGSLPWEVISTVLRDVTLNNRDPPNVVCIHPGIWSSISSRVCHEASGHKWRYFFLRLFFCLEVQGRLFLSPPCTDFETNVKRLSSRIVIFQWYTNP